MVLLACAPQSMALYETAPLGLVARSRADAAVLVAGSVIAKLALKPVDSFPTLEAAFRASAPLLIACLYLPALVMVLRRPNDGTIESDRINS